LVSGYTHTLLNFFWQFVSAGVQKIPLNSYH